MADSGWYLGIRGKQLGPFERAELETRLAQGGAENAKVWREGMADWLPLRGVPELAGLLPAAAKRGPPRGELANMARLPSAEIGGPLVKDGAAPERAPLRAPLRVERAADGSMMLPCPKCRRPTSSLKSYSYFRYLVFLLAAAFYGMKKVTCCPSCMRGDLAINLLINMVPANLLWLIIVLPLNGTYFLATFLQGHSKAVTAELEMFSQE